MAQQSDGEMRGENDFSRGVRGRHRRATRAGYTVTFRRQDGTTVVKEVKPNEGAVILDPDVREHFPDSKAVNEALRGLIRLVPGSE